MSLAFENSGGSAITDLKITPVVTTDVGDLSL
jgi:hypothetical protein